MFINYLIKIFKTKRKQFWIILSVSSSIVLLFGLCFTPIFRKIGFINTLAEKFIVLFFQSGNATTKSRFIIWEQSFQLLKFPYIFLGYGKTNSLDMIGIATNMAEISFHNSILHITVSFGLVGLTIFGMFVFDYWNKFLSNSEKEYKIILYAIFISSLLYGMMEVVVLFISSSSLLLISNVILSASYEIKTHEERTESYYEIQL